MQKILEELKSKNFKKSIYFFNKKKISQYEGIFKDSLEPNIKFTNDEYDKKQKIIINRLLKNKNLINIEKKLLTIIRKELFSKKKYNFSKKEVNFLLSHWIRRYSNLIINRFSNLILFENKNITLHFECALNQKLISINSYQYIKLTNDLSWNNYLYSQLVKKLNINSKLDNYKITKNIKFTKLNNFKNSFIFLILKLQNLFSNNKTIIFNTYLDNKTELEYAKSLKSDWLPSFPLPVINFTGETKERDLLIKKYSNQSLDIENILKDFLFKLLPQSFLETRDLYFQLIKKKLYFQYQLLISANHYDTNELFKYFIIVNKRSNMKYYLFQHGNNYFTHKDVEQPVETDYCDKFFTWGQCLKKNHIAAFNFKTVNKYIYNFNSNNHNKVLFILEDIQNNHTLYNLNNLYAKNLIAIYNLIPSNLKSKISLKFNKNLNNTSNIDYFIKSNFNVISKFIKFHDLIRHYCLVVFNYDSTGFLECISVNKPCILYLPENKFNHLNSSYLLYYKHLLDNNIIHFSKKTILPLLEMNSSQLNQWWYSIDNQMIINNFKNKFSKHCSSLDKLINITKN